jgi:hypothetical protein
MNKNKKLNLTKIDKVDPPKTRRYELTKSKLPESQNDSSKDTDAAKANIVIWDILFIFCLSLLILMIGLILFYVGWYIGGIMCCGFSYIYFFYKLATSDNNRDEDVYYQSGQNWINAQQTELRKARHERANQARASRGHRTIVPFTTCHTCLKDDSRTDWDSDDDTTSPDYLFDPVTTVNPATGLFMQQGGTDVAGNFYGTSSNDVFDHFGFEDMNSADDMLSVDIDIDIDIFNDDDNTW